VAPTTTTKPPGEGISTGDLLKRVLVGRRVSSSMMEHTLLPKSLALPVFSSDALSSVAYATEEILHVLLPASVAAATFVMPISMAIATLMVVVILSYRQTVRAYPTGGGSYIVSKEHLGTLPGLTAAAALLTDYVLTVSVSVAAGVFAIASAIPSLSDQRVLMAVGFVAFITLANLRGVRESGTLFAIPTYGFLVCIGLMLAVGMGECLFTSCPAAAVPPDRIGVGSATATVSLFILLRAFSSGSTALTGVEAIADGVPAFRRPQARNAATTLAMMGVISITMFLGISFLAQHGHAIPSEHKSVVAQIADGVFHGGFLFYLVQSFTAAILILAANTAYQDFPRLSSILARDRFLPSQFENRGDRLVFSNGIIVLALAASGLLIYFKADVSRLIQLYVIGVFTSFTLSQSGMVRRWIRLNRRGEAPPGWRRSMVINAIGAIATFVVLVVVIYTKFIHGAWIVLAAMPVIILGFLAIHRHYASISKQLRAGVVQPTDRGQNIVVLVVEEMNPATAEAVGYVRAFAEDFKAVHVEVDSSATDVVESWERLIRAGTPLEVIAGDKGRTKAVIDYVRSIPRGREDFVTVVIPEMLTSRSLLAMIRRPGLFTLKLRLLRERQVVITDVPVLQEGAALVAVDGKPLIPHRTVALIFVSGVNDATVRALNYARSLRANEIRAVNFALDPRDVEQLHRDWADRRIPVELDIVEAPFRDLGPPILQEVRRITAQGDSVAAVIMPELITKRWWHGLLHNQRALFIKRLLLFEPRVILSSVPYQLGSAVGDAKATV
jgi:amino acid transporter